MSPLWIGPLAMGFAGSAHCGAMCGAIASSGAATSSGRRAVLGTFLNAGRVLTYAIAGGLVGGLGALLGDISTLRHGFIALRGLAGALLVVLGVGLALRVRSFALLDRIGAPVWRIVRPWALRLSGPSTPGRAFAFGALWGLLPCGLVYAALGLAATSGSVAGGAMTMLAFGAGTLPALVLIGSLAARLRRFVARTAVRASVGLVVALSGLVNIASASPGMWGGRFLSSATHTCCQGVPDGDGVARPEATP
jgi:sulfite exporter TauE/SafE